MNAVSRKYYISEWKKPYEQGAGANFWQPFELPRNMFKGENYFGFKPEKNLNMSKEELFRDLHLWESPKGICQKGSVIRLVSKNNYIFRTHSENQIIIFYQKTPIFAGDILEVKNLNLHVVKAHGEYDGVSNTYTIDITYVLHPLSPKLSINYETFVAQDTLITNQYLQNSNIENDISDMIMLSLNTIMVAANSNPLTANIGVAIGGIIPVIQTNISALKSKNIALQTLIEDAKLCQ